MRAKVFPHHHHHLHHHGHTIPSHVIPSHGWMTEMMMNTRWQQQPAQKPLLDPLLPSRCGYGNKAADIISSFNGCQSCQRFQLAGVAVARCFCCCCRGLSYHR